ncbi:MAG: helix-turn-helix domain-containing protein [Armatimonadota bacterium]
MLGHRVRQLRQNKHLSIEKAAWQARISASMWRKTECGERTPSNETLRRIAHVLGVAPDDILFGARQ